MKAHEVVDYLYEKHPALRDEQLAAATARAERAEAALAERDAPCVWRYIEIEKEPWGLLDAHYLTACNHTVPDLADLPYCPYCGHAIQAYAGDLADLVGELQARAERAEAALAERDEHPSTTTGDFRRARGVIPWQPGNEPAETTIRRLRDAPERAERAEAALVDCRRVIAAIPWRALASIYAHPGVVLDADADAIGEFLDQYADAWAGGFAPSDNGSSQEE